MKKRTYIRKIAAMLAALVLLSVFAGCSQKNDAPPPIETGPRTLWVVTEETKEDAMRRQIQDQIKEFQQANQDVTINLQILPMEEEARSVELEKLRTQIMAGHGPDVYLLPNKKMTYTNVILTPPYEIVNEIEPLFQDVAQSMHNGLFADISAYYDADDSLGKEAFAKGVMDAGVLDGGRYVLPIRYSFPVVYFEREGLTELGLDVDKMLQNVNSLLDELVEKGGTDWPGASDLMTGELLCDYLLTLFSPAFDYEASALQLDMDAFTHFTESMETLSQRAPTTGWIDMLFYVTHEAIWNTEILGIDSGEDAQSRQCVPLAISSSTEALDAAILAKALGQNIEAAPLRSADDSVVANIHYWGAVGANCACPSTAYQFLREFLLEDTQWELNRPRYLDEAKDPVAVNRNRYYTGGYIADGLPVRIQGAVEPLQETLQYDLRHMELIGDGSSYNGKTTFAQRRDAVKTTTVTQADVPILNTVIDRAEFTPPMVHDLFDELWNCVFREGDFSAFIENAIQQLEWHISEG